MRNHRGLLKPHGQAINVAVRFLDLGVLALSGWVAHWLRFGSWSLTSDYAACLLGGTLLAAIIMPLGGLYQSWRGVRAGRIAAYAILAWAVTFGALLILLWAAHWGEYYSRLWLGYWGLLGAIGLAMVRLAAYLALAWARRRGFNVRRVVLFGAGELGRRAIESANKHEWTGFKVVALLDDDPSKAGSVIGGLEVQRPTAGVDVLAQRAEADEVWLALPLKAELRVREIMQELRHSTVNIRLMPDIFGLRLLNHSVSEIAGIPTLNLTESPHAGFNRFVKAAEDRILAALILLAISPLMIGIAIGIKLTSPGPVFFRQERVGWNGRVFSMLKFRSMPLDAETQTGAKWATADDKRATRLGAFLRRTSLDELPQFLNVLKGDMSIVGPRPERPVFVEQFKDEIPDYMQKHLVKAGITGWAQVNGWRGNTDLTKRIEFDLHYIENWSLYFDLTIIVR